MSALPDIGDPFPADIPLPRLSETASGLPWKIRPGAPREALAIKQATDLDYVICRVLAARGVKSGEVDAYLNPTLRSMMPDPFVLAGMEQAADRLAAAIINDETIAVFGDYDVDGTTSSALLSQYLAVLGKPLLVHLPDRITEGYGPSVEAFANLQSQGATLIVTVDCGASAHDVIAQAAAGGASILVIDHHQMSGPPPEGAAATVNPNRLDDMSGLGGLSAAGVTFMTLAAVNRELRRRGYFGDKAEPDLLGLLDLVALGLVCDVMPMVGLTRVLVSQGLKVLSSPAANMGLRALGEVAGVKGRLSAYHLGFLLGPRINAAGRIGHASKAFKLLTCADIRQCRALAEELHRMNAARQEIEAAVIESATAQIEAHQRQSEPVIIAAGEGWHQGVIGIAAGRIKEAYNAPSIVISLENGVGKGSGRSIEGVDLGAAISAAREEGLLSAGGGHAMAAGLTLDEANIERLRQFLTARLAEAVKTSKANAAMQVDAVLAADAITGDIADRVEAIGPFGPGNAEPVFAAAELRVSGMKIVGTGHLSLTLASRTGTELRGIAFRAAGGPIEELAASGRPLAVSGRIRRDEWRGGDKAQLHISDIATIA